ncbi:MAG: zinc-binding alcohol dehydrogenase family protein [Verrucomicrobiota bacterium]|nr:zinc-binding alcohol dehydrogenase family protein [Verrucomicrobiota bacterium]
MKAWTITGPGKAALVEMEKPAPDADEVLLKIHVAGYCGSDLNTFRGANPLVTYPRVPGHELAGAIEARGPEVPAEWAPGLEVTLSPYTHCGRCSACRQGRFHCCRHNETLGVQRDGGLAEFIVAPWQKLFRSPKLPLRELALVEPLTIGFHAVDRGRVTPRDAVLVLGCGAIGLGAIAGAAARGARVIAVDVDDAKLQLAKKCGARETANSQKSPLHDLLEKLTGGDGPEVVIEAVGLPETFRAAVEEAGFAGRVVYIGYAKKPVEYETKLFVQKELDILGSRNATPAEFKAVIQFLEGGTFPVGEVITRTVPFAEAGAALRAWSDQPAAFTKIQIAMSR